MIRTATPEDIPRIVELGAVMHQEAPRFRDFPYLPERCAESVARILAHPHGIVLVADIPDDGIVGGIMAVAVPHYACDFIQACDLALFISPEFRGSSTIVRLLKAYREWAWGMGAEPNIGLNTGVAPERTAKLLSALGAEQTGSIWTWGAVCA
jgi:GNAT superfamily N-acetyltransferase